ncbi:MAG: dihydrofolate reductase [Bacteroidales bacterium]|nr:dihydrofolate reductase [Bacteroidales bacterium]
MIIQNLAIIVAIAQNGAIGKKNQLLWHIPEDLKYFKETTINHPVIMGWNTWLSLPKKPLPNRLNIILSYENTCLEGCKVFTNIPDCLEFVKQQDKTCFVIGGASIYKQMIKYCNQLFITWIEKNCDDADAFFPLEEIHQFQLISEKQQYANSINANLRFCVYLRNF